MSYVRSFADTDLLVAGESTMPRKSVSSSLLAAANGVIRFAYFTARRTETVSKVRTQTGTTAQSGATLCKVGVYSVDDSGDLTLVAATANDTTLWVVTNTTYTTDLTASFTKTRGQRYAVGVLTVGASTTATFCGQSALQITDTAAAPMIASQFTGQTDFAGSLTSPVASALIPYMVLLP